MSANPEQRAQALRDAIRRVGVWLGPIGLAPAGEERAAIRRIEQLGYGAAWFGEAPTNREAMSHAGLLLGATQRLMVATGIANIWARDAIAAINAANTLNEGYGERFMLGLGVSHAPAVRSRGHEYAKPLTAMRTYLEAIDAHTYGAPAPAHPSPIVLAALRPKMLELARDKTAGAHPYFVPPAHTARAREILGPSVLLAPEQAVVLESEPGRAREMGRRHMAMYLKLPNYVNNLRTLGYDDADFADGGSDKLVDAIVAWGDEDAIAGRVREHLDAGADHVAVQSYADDAQASLAQLERLAPVLLAL
ncbi:MAG: family F420-dependent class oxidoreductase [Solirubrobacterales bacterium]|jgi:probable F420-dependent oxidoreductase|nr:family F420-dependent class oxidoreductase [Solirubrobacterales bacterium]